MMNIPPSEAKCLSLAEYEGLLWHWNDAHTTDEDREKTTTDPRATMRHIEQLNSDLRLNPPHHKGEKKPKKA